MTPPRPGPHARAAGNGPLARSLDDFAASAPAAAVELLHRLRDAILDLGEVDERIGRTRIAWARRRVFAEAAVESGRLEIAIHLRREIDHPLLLAAFAARRVVTHHLALTDPGQADDEIRELLAEAYETVGPGTR